MPDNNRLDQIELRSEEVQEVLSKPPHWMIRWGSFLFFMLILLFLFISWFIRYPDVIESEALISTEIPPQKEFARRTGKLSTLMVTDNERVTPNTPLAILENSANYQDVFLLKSVIESLTVNNKDFSFPIDSIPVLFLGDIDAQFALFENSYLQYRLNKELNPFSNQAIANGISLDQLKSRLETLELQKDISQKELSINKIDLKRNKDLLEKGIISAQQYEKIELQFAQAERNHKNFESSISQIKENISNARRNVRDNDINKVREDLTLFKKVIQSFNQLKKAIKEWELNYVLLSKIQGRVSFMNYWNVNQTVNQGDLVFTIIPDESSSFIAKLKTPTLNSGKIEKGQKVNVKLQNYPYREFGILEGTIEKISAVPNQEGLYLIDALLPDPLITSHELEIEFKQEMVGTASIILEDLRLIERFFYELRGILTK